MGQKQNGKDVSADYIMSVLQNKLNDSDNWERASFAKHLKKIYCETFGVDEAFVEEWKTKSEIPPGFDKSVRESLTFIGDGFREIQEKIWIDLVFRDRNKSIVISDGRYINELLRVTQENGINILIYRPGFLNYDENKSESTLRPMVQWFLENGQEGSVDNLNNCPIEHAKNVNLFLKNDGTIEDLHEKIDAIVIPYIMDYYNIQEN